MKKLSLYLIMMICLIGVVLAATSTSTINTATNLWQTTSNPIIDFTCTGAGLTFNASIYTNAYNTSNPMIKNSSDDVFASVNNTADFINLSVAIAENNTGVFKFFIECIPNTSNITANPPINSSNITIRIDTIAPSTVTIENFADGDTCVDAVPEIEFSNSTEENFNYYNITLFDTADTSSFVTTLLHTQYATENVNNTIKINISLPTQDKSYNVSISIYDDAGNIASASTNSRIYTHNSIGYSLRAGWNILGIVRNGDVNLSVIASETNANIVSWYNNSAGGFVTHTAGSTTNDGFNLNRNVPIGNNSRNNVFLYMASAGNWQGCGRNFSSDQNFGWDSLNNNTNNGWNIFGIVRTSRTLAQINTSLQKGNISDVMSYVNSSNGRYYSYFANEDFNKGVLIKKGEAVWIRLNDSRYTVYNWTNQSDSV